MLILSSDKLLLLMEYVQLPTFSPFLELWLYTYLFPRVKICCIQVYEHKLAVRQLSSFVTLVNLSSFSQPIFLICQMSMIIGHLCFIGWLQGINKIMYVEYTAEFNKCEQFIDSNYNISYVIVHSLKYNLFSTFLSGSDWSSKR